VSLFLLDTSAFWHLMREDKTREAWADHIDAGSLRVCEATCAEILFSATGPGHREQLLEELNLMCEPVRVPKDAWRWVESAQYQLTRFGQHRSAGPMDLLVCATAVHHGLTVLHVDDDFPAVARVVPELEELDLRGGQLGLG
jgi:predicted nucleic acid-binding protein